MLALGKHFKLLLDLPTSWKSLRGTNTLAYYEH
jgi:hypothetical protein